MAGDTAALLLFAAIGRANHGESLDPASVLSVAWPFLAGVHGPRTFAHPITLHAWSAYILLLYRCVWMRYLLLTSCVSNVLASQYMSTCNPDNVKQYSFVVGAFIDYVAKQ